MVLPRGWQHRRGEGCNKDKKGPNKKGPKSLKKCARRRILKFFMRIDRVFNMGWQVGLATPTVALLVQNGLACVTRLLQVL